MRPFKHFGAGWLSLVVFLPAYAYATSAWQMNAFGATAPSIIQRKSLVRLDEEFSFNLTDLKMNHQGEVNTLNINVRYLYVVGIRDDEYPDFRLLLKDIEKFLESYPNEKDYWEILNKRMARMLLTRYPTLSRINIELRVSPSKLDPYDRSSTVTLSRATGQRKQTGGRD
jgi:hypothetical protein